MRRGGNWSDNVYGLRESKMSFLNLLFLPPRATIIALGGLSWVAVKVLIGAMELLVLVENSRDLFSSFVEGSDMFD